MGAVKNVKASELLEVRLTVKTQDGLVVTVDFKDEREFKDALRWIEGLS